MQDYYSYDHDHYEPLTSMEQLPDEVLAIVLSFLAPRDLLLSVEPLNLRFRELLSDEGTRPLPFSIYFIIFIFVKLILFN
jgi:hypothetical protein